ncbi:MAG TPA: hypothetical protein VH253_05915 [Phycisphaerae bacterium]|nr:hypothetical protein [Phycisphaerae bacterium]
MTQSAHRWHFFRAGGFDQVRLDAGSDLLHLDQLDQKLWVALACPVDGLEFDRRTLELIDADHDGRIRAPDIIAVSKWAGSLVKEPSDLLRGEPALKLAAINEQLPEGAAIAASARQILRSLGKAEAAEISVEDVSDTGRIFSSTPFNGDGIIPADAASDEAVRKVIEEILAAGAEAAAVDRSGKPGVTAAQTEKFFAGLRALVAWHEREASESGVLPIGEATVEAAAAVRAVSAKVEDYFARCRLAAFDGRALDAMNRAGEDYAAVASRELSSADPAVAAFPLARVEPGRALPLNEGVNPAWASAIGALRARAVAPVLGDRDQLTEAEWRRLTGTFAAYEAWQAGVPAQGAQKVGVARAKEILAGPAEAAIKELLAKDAALAPEAAGIAAVEKLVRLHRDLYELLNNFVAFRDFYGRRRKAIFQAGTLYLDQRGCDLCVRVRDAAKHAAMAHLSRMYLAYCDLSHKSTGETAAIAAAFTAGDSDNLMVGRNGVFYDRLGRDWDATITKIVENPISVRQAFWAPYKRAIRWVEDQIAKRAAAADAAATDRLQSAATSLARAAETGPAATTPAAAPPPAAPLLPRKLDVGVIAAIAVAFAGASAALGAILQAFFGLGFWMPLGLLAVILAISGPSMLIAWLKLRQRNLGPLLDANGWAVNAKAKINLPFGRALTATASLPRGAVHDRADPYRERHRGRWWTTVIVALLLALAAAWYFGAIERVFPGLLPVSGFVARQRAAATQAAAGAATSTAPAG